MNDDLISKMRLFHGSTYLALIAWGCAAFMAQPSIASMMVHFLLLPFILAALIWAAHHEAKTGK